MERQTELIKLLCNRQGFISVEDIGQELGVTARTVRNDLAELEKRNVKIIKKRNQGVSLDKTERGSLAWKHILEATDEKDYYTASEREVIIMEALLLEKDSLTLEKLKQETMSSKSSVIKNLVDCEEWLKKWNIVVKKKPRNGITIEYEEYNWRMAVLEHIIYYVNKMDFHQLHNNLKRGYSINSPLLSNDFIGMFIRHINTLYVVNFIKRYEEKWKIQFTDKAFISIFFYICIAVTRALQGKNLTVENEALYLFFKKSFIEKWIADNSRPLFEGASRKVSRYEMETIWTYMLSQCQYSEDGFLEKVFTDDVQFDNTTKKVTRDFIESVEKYLDLNLQEDEKLYENLLLHIRPTVFRSVFKIHIENPIREDIRKAYPAIMLACREASRKMELTIGAEINDDEISYLAMHIGAVVEKTKEKIFSGIYRTVIVCPEGKGTNSILYYRLLNQVPNIQIVQVCSIAEAMNIREDMVDFVISTVPLYISNLNVIQVNPLLKDEDIAKIRRTIKRIKLIKNEKLPLVVEDLLSLISGYAVIQNYEGLKRELNHYFNRSSFQQLKGQEGLAGYLNPAMIKLQVEAKDWKTAFRIAGELLYREGYVEKRYIDAIIRNAELYGGYMLLSEGVAFPHAKPMEGAKKIGMSFVTLKRPVYFENENERYKLWFIIALSADDSMRHLTAMGELIELVSREEKREELLGISDTESFIQCLTEQ